MSDERVQPLRRAVMHPLSQSPRRERRCHPYLRPATLQRRQLPRPRLSTVRWGRTPAERGYAIAAEDSNDRRAHPGTDALPHTSTQRNPRCSVPQRRTSEKSPTAAFSTCNACSTCAALQSNSTMAYTSSMDLRRTAPHHTHPRVDGNSERVRLPAPPPTNNARGTRKCGTPTSAPDEIARQERPQLLPKVLRIERRCWRRRRLSRPAASAASRSHRVTSAGALTVKSNHTTV